jgi:homopolymeric O-antigen transport system permease protein
MTVTTREIPSTAGGMARGSAPMTGRHLAGFAWTLVRTDFKTRYHGTLAGFFWALLKPLIMFVVLMGVFSFIFASTPTYRLDLIIGLFLWDFFAEGTKTGMTSLHAKGFLLTKARFPSWIVVLTSASNALMTLGAFILVILAYLALEAHMPGPAAIAMFLLYLMQYFLIVLGISLASSVLFLRYRDLNQVWDVVTQAGFFIAPIIYPLAILPERVHFYLYVWPPTPVIQFSRAVLVSGPVPTVKANLFLAVVTGIILATGVLVFRRYAPRAAEYL